jgi:predicted 3-demethylubiquinone-9 3-methyltransferase (glyoxalase superfamily)
MEFYTSVFKNSKIGNVSHYGEAGPGPKGRFLRIRRKQFTALNGGPRRKFNEAILLVIARRREKLSAGGQLQQCGWLKDKFGLSWQVVPAVLGEPMRDKDPRKSKRVMEAMLQMVKLDIPRLQAAYEGASAVLQSSACLPRRGSASIRRRGWRRLDRSAV